MVEEVCASPRTPHGQEMVHDSAPAAFGIAEIAVPIPKHTARGRGSGRKPRGTCHGNQNEQQDESTRYGWQ